MAYETELAQAETAQGLDNPTLSFNLAGANDYNPGLQFLDLTKMMRPWIGHEPDQWGGMTTQELRDGGYLDEDGWVKEIPEGIENIGTIWTWSDFLGQAVNYEGTYVVQYEGEGTIVLKGNATVISSEPGKIVFENLDAKTFMLEIHETDPSGTGDYIRNISVVPEEHLALHEAGALFNPDWLSIVENARELRFMDWMHTNGSEVTSWDDMPSADGPFDDRGMAIEHMVQLANETGTDPWFTMPHLADEEYIRNFAEYVRDNLDPSLTVRVEYSNENWNWAFKQTKWLLAQSQSEWGMNAHTDYHAKKAVETALIWEDVFGAQADDRLINVLGTHTANVGVTNRLLNPTVWQEMEPDTYVDPLTVFEELAGTTYFGHATVSNETLRDELIAAINDPDIDAIAFLASKFTDPNYASSIQQTAEWLANTAAIAQANGLKFTAYEGGQHVHHSFAIAGLTEEDTAAINDFMIAFVRSPEMADLYRELWDVWAEHGDGAFMQFGDIGTASKWGSWTLYNGLDDSNPRADALEELNATTTPWWEGAEGGEFRQQGVILNGTVDGETMIGTSQEDYLLGMGGNDVFIAGKGNDGINGGDGTDRVVLSGNIDDYVIRIEGDGYRVNGTDGSDFLINVEELAFSENQLIKFSDMIADGNGRLTFQGIPDAIEDAPTKGKGLAKVGKITNGKNYDQVKFEDYSGKKKGIKINAIDADSSLGETLGVSDTDPSYLSFAKGTQDPTNSFNSFLAGNQNAAGLSLKNGAIVTDAPEILATRGNDSFRGLSDNDHVSGQAGDDDLRGKAGRDVLNGNSGKDSLMGGNDSDELYGGSGVDHLMGDSGDDMLNGGRGADKLDGGTGMDNMQGGNGNDILRGRAGDDVHYGGAGADYIGAGTGDDDLFGGNGADNLQGREGNDMLFGGSGHDAMRGGNGKDMLRGGEGNDVMYGGGGSDTFVFKAGSGADIIVDFAKGDHLDLGGFLNDGQSLDDAARMKGGDLMLTNGEDTIKLLDLDKGDLGWIESGLV